MKKFAWFLCAVILICLLLEFGGEDGAADPVYIDPDVKRAAQKYAFEEIVEDPRRAPEPTAHEKLTFSLPSGFYEEDIEISLYAGEGVKIYYTTDGSVPTEQSREYRRPFYIKAWETENPQCTVIRAAAFYPDGLMSQVLSNTYFVGKGISGRFSTLVFSVMGDPADLTEPTGILFGDNVYQRGRASERAVHVQIFDQNGKELLSQDAGMRVNGGASRTLGIKSLKLYARRDYGEKSFEFSGFGTESTDSGGVIGQYQKMVLRSTSNDLYYAYIRDEFCERLASSAGFEFCEGVMPVVTYLNGRYYALHWLHENYCEAFFEEKYGKGEGKYTILEGSEQAIQHTDPDDTEYYEPLAVWFDETYDSLSSLDLTQEENFRKVCEFIDLENYFQYYAFNIYIGNSDWPHNNEKILIWTPYDEISYEEGTVRDGRARFMLHDMDYALAIYDGFAEGKATRADCDTLSKILNPESSTYSPLFAALMQRKDCREMFKEQMMVYINTVFEPENMLNVLDEVDAERASEIGYYIRYLQSLGGDGDFSRASEEVLQYQMELIRTFIRERPLYMRYYMDNDLYLNEKTGADAPVLPFKPDISNQAFLRSSVILCCTPSLGWARSVRKKSG